MLKITLITLGLGGILFAMLMAIPVWFESGSRRKKLHLMHRIIIWGISVPIILAISIFISILLMYLITGGEPIGGPFFTIISYGAIIMIPMGALAGLLSHFLLEYTREQSPP